MGTGGGTCSRDPALSHKVAEEPGLLCYNEEECIFVYEFDETIDKRILPVEDKIL